MRRLIQTLAGCIVEVEVNFHFKIFQVTFINSSSAQRQLNDKGSLNGSSLPLPQPEEAQDVERLQDLCFVLIWNGCDSVFTTNIDKWPPVRI